MTATDLDETIEVARHKMAGKGRITLVDNQYPERPLQTFSVLVAILSFRYVHSRSGRRHRQSGSNSFSSAEGVEYRWRPCQRGLLRDERS